VSEDQSEVSALRLQTEQNRKVKSNERRRSDVSTITAGKQSVKQTHCTQQTGKQMHQTN